MSLIKRIINVGGLTLISRVLGFARDILMASALGAGLAADAFFIAFKLPNFFRRLFAEGAFTAGFVPLFAKRLGRGADGKEQAISFASKTLGVFLPTLLLVLALFEISMPWVMELLTGGFDEAEPQKFDLVVKLARITFPYLLLISLVTLLAGVLNGLGKFSAAAFAPVFLNICMIAGLLFWPGGAVHSATTLAIAVSIAGIVQLLWLLIAVWRANITITLPKPKLTPSIKQLVKVAGPAAVGAGIMQINLLVDLLIAARMLPEGSISYLFYADRLNQLPIGIIGVAIGTVLLPSISKALGAGDTAGAQSQQNRAMEFALFLTLPAAAALMVMPQELISSLFERGAFTSVDTTAAAMALVAYASGLPAYVVIKVLTPGFFARQNTKTPVKIAIFSLILNTSLNLILIIPLAHVGLALATSIAAWVNAALLYYFLRRDGHFILDDRLKSRLWRIVTSTLFMGVVLILLVPFLEESFNLDGFARIKSLIFLIIVGVVSYSVASLLLGSIKKADFKSFLGQNK